MAAFDALLSEYADAEFACGEWQPEDDDPYGPLSDAAGAARKAIRDHVRTLLAALSSATARAVRAEADAARYRYVRELVTEPAYAASGLRFDAGLVTPEQYDAMIDRALQSRSASA